MKLNDNLRYGKFFFYIHVFMRIAHFINDVPIPKAYLRPRRVYIYYIGMKVRQVRGEV